MDAKILVGRLEQGRRFAFVHPIDPAFLYACRALEIRGWLRYASNPVQIDHSYESFFADLDHPTQENYDRYAWLAHTYFSQEEALRFESMFKSAVRGNKPALRDPNYHLDYISQVKDLVDKFKGTPTPLTFYGKPFPAEGVLAFLETLKNKNGLRGLINNFEPGMGKTRIGIVAGIYSEMSVLVLAPKTAKATAWPNEFAKLNFKDYRHINRNNWDAPKKKFDLLQWEELLAMPQGFFEDHTYQVILGDEIHFAANGESKRGSRLDRLMRATHRPLLWGMTGTAIRKRPSDMIHLLSLVNHPLINSQGHRDEQKVLDYLSRYCGEFNGFLQRWDFRRPKNLDELHALLGDVIFRREKAETDLPGQSFIPVRAQIGPGSYAMIKETWGNYEKLNAKRLARLSKIRHSEVRNGILRKAAAYEMVPHTLRFSEKMVAKGKKVILFTAYTEPWRRMKDHFGSKAVAVNGSSSAEARSDAEYRFQNDPTIKVFVGNEVAAGVSMTLTAASDSIFNDFSWSTSNVEQAAGRNNRGGSTETGNNWMMFAEDTMLKTVLVDFKRHQKVNAVTVGRRDGAGELVRKINWLPMIEAEQEELALA